MNAPTSAETEPWHARAVEDVLRDLAVEVDRGLDEAEARARLRRHGANQLQATEGRPWWRVLLAQLNSVVIYLLGGAAVLAFVTQRWPEGVAVLAVLVVNTAIGFFSEWKAVRSMAALRALGEHTTRVRREGREEELPAPQLVPGDVVLLSAGELVPSDLRLVEAEHARVDEAPLTGESVPSNKTTEPVDADTALGERESMAYKGTRLADGRAIGVAVATGPRTELGRISELAKEAQGTVTPLQRRLDRLGRVLGLVTVAIALVVAAVGFSVRQQEATLVVETALALGIAAIPEGLPIVSTIALARGMYVMAKRNALVNQLTAVETLGATRVIFSDKTGTLTENRMRLEQVWTAAGTVDVGDRYRESSESKASGAARSVLEVVALCNRASLDRESDDDDPAGDPTEVALLRGARELDIEREALLSDQPEVRIEEFDPRTKKMATFHETDQGVRVAVKGAPHAVLEICTEIITEAGEKRALESGDRDDWSNRATELAERGLRVLAVAEKRVRNEDVDPYEDLCFLGLTGLLDPPRERVKPAVDSCQAAGIRVEMVTGDQPETAKAIASAVGIVGDADDPESVVMLGRELEDPESVDQERGDAIHRANIFARVSPEQKLNLVKIYQDHGEIVAMTGDGINDAPALKKADIGIAMGRRGTEAAKQVADMVLRDDAFESIVAAVEQGRVIFGNIRKSVMFMLTTNVAEVIAVAVATFVGWPLPLRPLQILYLNVLTDVFPALALGVGPASGSEMKQPPRDPQEPVLTRRHWFEIVGLATVIAACVLAGLMSSTTTLHLEQTPAVTVSFLTLAFAKLWFTFALRDKGASPIFNEITRNPWVWGAIALCVALLLGAVYLPGLSSLLQTEAPGGSGWALMLALSAVPLLVGQALRALQARASTRGATAEA
jgi:Ca2+-transporting ATPase